MSGSSVAAMQVGASFRAMQADARLSEAFLPRVTLEEEAAIAEHLEAVVLDAHSWCDDWTLFNRGTILPVSLLTCVQFPHLTSLQVSLRVRSTLWIYALDDAIDGGQIADGDLSGLLDECFAVARTGCADVAMHELARSLAHLRSELSVQPLWAAVFPAWITSLDLLVDGMVREHAARQQMRSRGHLSAPLSIDEYLAFASHSIGLPHQWVAGLAMEPDPEIAETLAPLVVLAERCGMVMRLANDGATWRREEDEGGVNAVRLEQWSCSAGVPLNEAIRRARRRVHGRMDQELQQCRELAARLGDGSSVAHRFVRATEFGVDLYARHDFRTWADALNTALGRSVSCP